MAPSSPDPCLSALTGLRRKDIDPGPHLSWCPPVQVIMGTFVVVPLSNICQAPVELVMACQRLLPQLPFHRANEPLHPAVLPGTTRLDALMPNVQQPQAESEEPRDQHHLVIGADELRRAVSLRLELPEPPKPPRQYPGQPGSHRPDLLHVSVQGGREAVGQVSGAALPFPGLDDEIGYTLKVGEVVGDQGTLAVQCGRGNEQIRIREQRPLSVKVAIQRGGAFHYLIGERKDEAGLTQQVKRGFLCPCLFGLQPSQQFVAGDDREGEPFVLRKIGSDSVDDEGMLFEEFGRNIGVEENC